MTDENAPLGSPDPSRGGPDVDAAVENAEEGTQVEGVHTPSGQAEPGESRLEQMREVDVASDRDERARRLRRPSGRLTRRPIPAASPIPCCSSQLTTFAAGKWSAGTATRGRPRLGPYDATGRRPTRHPAAGDDGAVMHIEAPTLGAAWIAVADLVLDAGRPGSWDGLPLREVLQVTLEIDAPAPTDPVIARHADPERLAWMHANFTDHARVPALGDADSYATRLYDYARSGRDQVAWVVDGCVPTRPPATRPSPRSSR